jgi:hypothetical protein
MTRRATDTSIRISRRTIAIAGTIAAVAVALAVLVGLTAVLRANEPLHVATSAQLDVQQRAAERDIERAYEQSATQITRVRALNLAITQAQAEEIATKHLTDLRTLRHNAFISLGQVLGLAGADIESYATATAQRFDREPVATAPSPTPVLLAPRFYTIVTRMSELATQIADQATTALTAPAPTPSPTARPSGSPSPSPSR